MGKPDAPTPPDPYETAEAQTGTNIGTAIANNTMGNVNQVTPQGNLTYSNNGYETYTGPNGESYQIPRTTATTTLNDTAQATFDQNQNAQLNLGTLANERSEFLRDYLPTTEAATDSIDSKLFELGSKRLDPRFDREQDGLQTRMANQGITAGSEAWQREMDQFGQTKNDAYNQLMLNGRGQASNEVNMPINQITALLSGSQVSNPNVQMNAQQGMATTDIGGLINQNYGQQQQNYQNEMSQSNGLMGGLFGLGGSAIMASDRRMKKDIVQIGKMNGLGVYSFRYNYEEPEAELRMGFMADEVENIAPNAVHVAGDGFKRVDYAKALEAIG